MVVLYFKLFRFISVFAFICDVLFAKSDIASRLLVPILLEIFTMNDLGGFSVVVFYVQLITMTIKSLIGRQFTPSAIDELNSKKSDPCYV